MVTTTRDKRQGPSPDLVKRQFVVTDVYSRKVVGWAFGANMTADLVTAALNMALLTRSLSR